MRNRAARCLALGPALAAALSTAPARAWVEARVVGDEARVAIDRAGVATVDESVLLQIAGSPLKAFDVPGVAADVTAEPDATAVPAQTDGATPAPVPLVVTAKPGGGLHVVVAQPRGLARGRWLVKLRLAADLVARGAIERDGAMLRARWTGPAWTDGVDGARLTFVLPPAPIAPRAIAEGMEPLGPEGAPAARRTPDRDEVELVRAHVARGEAASWSVRLDPRAVPDVRDPRLRPAAPPAPPPPAPASDGLARLACLAAAALALTTLVAAKAREVARHAAAAGTRARPLLPIGIALRAALAGPLFAAGVAWQLGAADPLPGSLLIAASAALGLYRVPLAPPRLRAPGRWLPLADRDAFARPRVAPGTWLDASTAAGRATALAMTLVVIASAAALATWASRWHAWLAMLDAVPFFALLGTGRVCDLPADPARAPARAAAWLARALRARGLRAVPWGRFPSGGAAPDELRLLVAPSVPRRGLLAIEIAWAWTQGAGGALGLPELLVRVVDASPCHDALSAAAPGLRWVRGRTAEERVATFLPRLPGRRAMLALTLHVASLARDADPAGAAIAPSARQPATSAARSGGSSERTTNAGTAASPAHAT